MESPGLSLIIAFYNKLDKLRLILASLEIQTFRDFEVLIADDGSSAETVKELKVLMEASELDLRHLWHEDRGWRKNIILNRAVMAGSSDYLMFIDGDCILHPRCLEEHFRARRPGWVTAGRRVNLTSALSGRLTEEKIRRGRLWGSMMPSIAWASLFSQDVHFENALYFRSRFLRSRINKKDKGLLGSHFSMFRKDLVEVNGFDERFLYPAVGEDTDLELRLRRNGVKVQTLKHIAIQYHLWHESLPREKANLEIMEENNKGGVTYTPFGIVRKP